MEPEQLISAAHGTPRYKASDSRWGPGIVGLYHVSQLSAASSISTRSFTWTISSWAVNQFLSGTRRRGRRGDTGTWPAKKVSRFQLWCLQITENFRLSFRQLQLTALETNTQAERARIALKSIIGDGQKWRTAHHLKSLLLTLEAMLSEVAFALLFLSGVQAAIGPVADVHIVNRNIAPDGFTRSGVLAGDTASTAAFPGPLIKGSKGDTFQLNVINALTDPSMLRSTSIHWHGIFQEGSSWADGPVGVTQCPISPTHSFLYQFSVPDQAGTFWYHSHLSTQYCDGLRGVFVVYDPSDPHASRYDIDDESTIITLADWYHVPAPSAGAVPTPDATLINGLGRYAAGPTSPLAIINVISGKRYRFRLVAISCDPNYVFSIDGHTMTIIETDGINVEPLVVDSIQIFAGQRYSFVLTANQPVSNYWVRALPNIGSTGFLNGINSAILRYNGATAVDPTTTQSPSTSPMLETNLHPLSNPGAPGSPVQGGVDVPLNLALSFAGGRFKINGATFDPPSVPVLLQIVSGARTAQELLPPGSVYTLPPNKVVELSIPGGAAGSPHPFHLHGHAFDVVRSAGSSAYNYANPVRRDVVSTGRAGDNVTIRFTTDNAGPWILHCHIDWHLETGLAIVFAEDADTVAGENRPAAWDDLCPIYNALDEGDR